jgi:hypothetical protein
MHKPHEFKQYFEIYFNPSFVFFHNGKVIKIKSFSGDQSTHTNHLLYNQIVVNSESKFLNILADDKSLDSIINDSKDSLIFIGDSKHDNFHIKFIDLVFT